MEALIKYLEDTRLDDLQIQKVMEYIEFLLLECKILEIKALLNFNLYSNSINIVLSCFLEKKNI